MFVAFGDLARELFDYIELGYPDILQYEFVNVTMNPAFDPMKADVLR